MKIACHRCGRPTGELDGLCDECRGVLRPVERPYDDPKWRARRAAFLRSHPWCEECETLGLSVKATVADHWPMSRKELLANGETDPDQSRYLRPLCTGHHNAGASSHTIRFDNDPA